MPSRAIPLFAVLLACLGLTFGLAACGGDDDSTTASVELTELPGDPQGGSEPSTSQPPASPDDDGGAAAGDGGDDDAGAAAGGDDASAGGGAAADEEGKAIFTQSCAGCHTLADAGASGSVGPNLDDARPSAEAVAAMVRGGGGGMPSFGGTLQPEQIDAVAAYVASAAGS
ncbi:MAG TPA: c-type cytochrome [Conexibacter sp.]|nr:c-type cytochrome [Conexibacter sp.]